ncbi:MAG: OmpA family protein [Bacteroidia bacterium]|nr:OmpA family protein [Bacteroidia bacterium]
MKSLLQILTTVCTCFIAYPGLAQKNVLEVESPVYQNLNVSSVEVLLTIRDAELNDPIRARIKICELEANSPIDSSLLAAPQGQARFHLSIHKAYTLHLRADKYRDTTLSIDARTLDKDQIEKEIKLYPHKLDMELTIRDIDNDQYVNLGGVLNNQNRNEQILLNPNEAINNVYHVKVREDDEYEMEVKQSDGYVFYTNNRIVPKRNKDNKMEVKVTTSLRPNAKIPLYNITFASRSAELNAQSIKELKRVVALLRHYPSAKLEIAAHTDSLGLAEFNRQLSQRRADVVFDYLVNQGIPPANLHTKGYGSSQPVASNESEEGRARNRRFELVVLSLE